MKKLEKRMRSLFAAIIAVVLARAASAQQQQVSNPDQPKAQPQAQAQQQKKQAKQPAQQAKPEETAPKPTEPAPKAGDDKKEEHYDMTDVPPVVTHHETKLDGKTLKYAATTGRLPIKRGD